MVSYLSMTKVRLGNRPRSCSSLPPTTRLSLQARRGAQLRSGGERQSTERCTLPSCKDSRWTSGRAGGPSGPGGSGGKPWWMRCGGSESGEEGGREEFAGDGGDGGDEQMEAGCER